MAHIGSLPTFHQVENIRFAEITGQDANWLRIHIDQYDIAIFYGKEGLNSQKTARAMLDYLEQKGYISETDKTMILFEKEANR